MPAAETPPAPGAPGPDDSLLGTSVAGRYKILSFLAQGGMGRIYRAEQLPLGRIVALKILHPSLSHVADAEGFQKRFLREAATCARLTHPNTIRIFDYGKLDERQDVFFMAMELLEGRTLSSVIRAEAPFAPSRAFRIASQIARSLREAHRLGIVHRDLKSPNVMLIQIDGGESVKVLDFGLAKVIREDGEDITLEGSFIGSPRYMSPEQIRQAPIDARTDLYSLGVILYEMLSGKTPFDAGKAMHTMMAHLNEPVPAMVERTGVTVAPAIESLVQRCLAKEPDERFADADAFFAAVREIEPSLSDESGVRSAADGRRTGLQGVLDSLTPAPWTDSRPGLSSARAAPAPASPRPAPPDEPTLASTDDPDAPVATAPVGPVTSPRRRSLGLALAGLAAAGLALFALVSPSSRPARPSPPVAPVRSASHGPEVAAAPRNPPAPVPTAARPASLRLESSPPGAEVWRGETLLGTTPLTMSLGDTTHSLSIRAQGYLPETLVQAPASEDVVRVVRLSRRRGPDVPRAPGKAKTQADRPPDLGIKTAR